MIRKHPRIYLAILMVMLVGGLVALSLTVASGQETLWTRQFGTDDDDSASGVATDAVGSVYVVGTTFGSLSGQENFASDAFIRKYSNSGEEVWTRQFGAPDVLDTFDAASGVAVDGLGSVYVVGHTTGPLPGQVYMGDEDAFVRKYDAEGSEIWTRQFGTEAHDVAQRVAVDSAGSIYVVGGVEGALPGETNLGQLDAFARKYDSDGKELWTRQFGTEGIRSRLFGSRRRRRERICRGRDRCLPSGPRNIWAVRRLRPKV